MTGAPGPGLHSRPSGQCRGRGTGRPLSLCLPTAAARAWPADTGAARRGHSWVGWPFCFCYGWARKLGRELRGALIDLWSGALELCWSCSCEAPQACRVRAIRPVGGGRALCLADTRTQLPLRPASASVARCTLPVVLAHRHDTALYHVQPVSLSRGGERLAGCCHPPSLGPGARRRLTSLPLPPSIYAEPHSPTEEKKDQRKLHRGGCDRLEPCRLRALCRRNDRQ